MTTLEQGKPTNVILLGDSRKTLLQLPANSYSCAWQSPPYALSARSYTKDGVLEIGREETVDEYLDALQEVANALKRLLKPWGTQIWNIGDRFVDKHKLRIPSRFADRMKEVGYYEFDEAIWSKGNGAPTSAPTHFRPDYEPIMFFAREDQERYFFDLNAVRVPLADSTVERYEYEVGGFSNLANSDGITYSNSPSKKRLKIMPKVGGDKYSGNTTETYSGNMVMNSDGNANLGAVWMISPQLERFALEFCPTCDQLRDEDHIWQRCGKCQKYRFPKAIKSTAGRTHERNNLRAQENRVELCPICKVKTNREIMCSVCDKECHSHYALFPLELARRVIKSCCPEFVCSKCGTPRRPNYKVSRVNTRPGDDTNNDRAGSLSDPNAGLHNSDWSKYRQTSVAESAGFLESCNCGAPFEPGIVIDSFMGWGTSAVAAVENNRNYLGCELNQYNIRTSIRRLERFEMERKLGKEKVKKIEKVKADTKQEKLF